MSLSKRHFETIAVCFRNELDETLGDGLDERPLRGLARRLAIEFKVENPRFDELRFYRACGFDPYTPNTNRSI